MKMNDLLTFLNKISHRPSQIFHYEREILRHRNQLQYIARKSIRMPSPISFQKSPHISTKNPSQTVQSLRNLSPLLESSIVLYLVYRIRHENVHFTSLWSELESFLKIYFTSKQFAYLYKRIKNFSWDIALRGKTPVERLSLRFAMPSFFIQQLVKKLGMSEAEKQIKAISKAHKMGKFSVVFPSSYSIPQNQNLTQNQNSEQSTIYSLLNICAQKKVHYQQHAHIPSLFIFNNRDKSHLIVLPEFRNAHAMIQEIPSYITIYVGLEAARSASLLKNKNLTSIPLSILEYCAAPGSKTRLIETLKQPNDRVLAQDIHTQRIHTIPQLIQAPNLNFLQADGITPCYRLEMMADNFDGAKFDLIFLDAPCTGSGTLHVNPELKWRQSENFLYKHVKLQEKLLQNAVTMLKPGGILIYSTCSLYSEENERHFTPSALKELKIRPLNLPSWISQKETIPLAPIPEIHQLIKSMHYFSPMHNSTAGFFLASFKRILSE